jgi:hypothetical protein
MKKIFLLFPALLFIISCHKNQSITSNAPSNTIIATYNGKTVQLPLQHTVGLYPGQTVQIITTAFPDISINLGACTVPNSGTYNFCLSGCNNGANTMTLSDSSGSYSANSTGSVNINFSNNVCSGTFTTIITGGYNGTNSLPINGSFNVSY